MSKIFNDPQSDILLKSHIYFFIYIIIKSNALPSFFLPLEGQKLHSVP